MVPAIFAFVVLVFFALLFYDKVDSDRQTAAS
jgi:hypothetical protein